MALAHAIGNDTVAAYQRSDLFDKRRNLMVDWARFLSSQAHQARQRRPDAQGGGVMIDDKAGMRQFYVVCTRP